MNIVVISPTYNERENVKILIPLLAKEFLRIKQHQMMVLFVDDNSPDGTASEIKKWQKKYPWVYLLEREAKQGLGMAYAAGMKHAVSKLEADALVEFDADMQHNPEDIGKLVAELDNGYDYVIASRYVKGGSIPKEWGFDRKFLSVVGNLVARVLLMVWQIKDVTTGFKLTRVQGYFDKLNLDKLISRQFAYKIQLLFEMVSAGAKVKEVPIHFRPRLEGESKLIKNEMKETLRVIGVLQKNNPRIRQFVKFGIVGFVGFILNSISLEVFRRLTITETLAAASYSLHDIWGLRIMEERSSWAAAMAAEVAIMSNFSLNNLWTFKGHKITSLLKLAGKFVQFNLTSIGAVVIQFAVIGSGVYYFGDTTLIRQLFLIIAIGVFIIPYNYFMYTRVIWKTKSK